MVEAPAYCTAETSHERGADSDVDLVMGLAVPGKSGIGVIRVSGVDVDLKVWC